ncbi:MAG: hypothetical protein ACXV1K_07065 [Kineosporiaceae bacterium]
MPSRRPAVERIEPGSGLTPGERVEAGQARVQQGPRIRGRP